MLCKLYLVLSQKFSKNRAKEILTLPATGSEVAPGSIS